MLFLLRKIRRSLMQKKKLTTYLLYAAGEIVLVVIGILIAVSINNRNGQQKQRAEEQRYLSSLLTELRQDSMQYVSTMNVLDRLENSARKVLDVIDDPAKEIEDSIAFINLVRTTYSLEQDLPEPTVWKELIATGKLSLIRDQDIITRLYEYYRRLDESDKDFEVNAAFYITKGRRLDANTFSIRDQDDYFDNWRIDVVPDKEVFTQILEDEEYAYTFKGIVTGMMISKIILKDVERRRALAVATIQENLY